VSGPPCGDDLVARLRRLDSAAVSDALDRCGIESGVITQLTRRSGGATIAGRAITVLLGPVMPASAAPVRHLATAAVEAAGPDDVIVIAHQGRKDCAGWGGNLSRAAAARGVSGTVVDGAVRDIDEAASIGYTVFSASTTPRTARGRTQEHDWGVPIDVAGVRVAPGDLVIADGTGIVVVSVERAHEIVEVAEHVAATEAQMASAIAEGTPISSVMGARYEQMVQQSNDGSGHGSS
jgi:4-hydroxy-4-methyl-2-oxoglutarate aldolase